MRQVSYIILITFILFSCSEPEVGKAVGEFAKHQEYLKTIDSDTFKILIDRVNFLKTEIKAFSPIIDAEFELFNVNGFNTEKNTSVPGGSSYDYRFVVKVDPSEVFKWTEGFSRNDSVSYDSTWTEKIIFNRQANWKRQSRPVVMSRPGSFVEIYVFEPEGIIFKRINAL